MLNKAKNIKVVLKNFGEITIYFSLLLSIPIIVSLIYKEGFETLFSYIIPLIIGVAIGSILKKSFHTKQQSSLMHAFITTILIWILLPVIGAVPFMLNSKLKLPFIDSYFESVSALTTTGLTMIQTQQMQNSLIFWRAFEGWIGGAGIIVLALVGITQYIKASRLMKAEGREERLRPNIINSIKTIWWVYALITIIGIALLLISGLDLFSSMNYSMSAISTTGVENYYGELEQIKNPAVEAALAIIMLMGATSFAVHYKFMKGKIKAYAEDTQTRIMIALTLIGAIIFLPQFISIYGSHALRIDLFHTISAITAGGFNAVNAANWNNSIKMGLALLMFIGGAAGSTAGGIKIIRFWVMLKSIWWKIKEKTLPEDAYFPKKINNKEVTEEEITSTYLFIILYAIFIIIGTITILYFNNNYSTTNVLFEVISAQGNAGITSNLTSATMNDITKSTLIANMIIGRIEIIPLLFGAGFLLHWNKGGL